MTEITVHHGDCREVLASLPDCSVDSVVTDPPYELGFMGKTWDASGVAYSVQLWAEVLRVLKPGGHLCAFGGTRTYHRMAVAIEDAGFEIRDSLHWVYGSGFPKSLDVSKAIDKAAGPEREVVGTREVPLGHSFAGPTYGGDSAAIQVDITAAATDAARQWDGWGTALKPAHETVILARKGSNDTVDFSPVPILEVASWLLSSANDAMGSSTSSRAEYVEALFDSARKLAEQQPAIPADLLEGTAMWLCAWAIPTTLSIVSSWLASWDAISAAENTSTTSTASSTTTGLRTFRFLISQITPENTPMSVTKAGGESSPAWLAVQTLCDALLNLSDTLGLPAPASATSVWQELCRAEEGSPAHEPIVLARKPLIGTVVANVLEHGTGALNIDATRIASSDDYEKQWDKPVRTNIGAGSNCYISDGEQHSIDLSANKPTGGRWPANVIFDTEAGAVLDEQSGAVGSWSGNPARSDGSIAPGKIISLGERQSYGQTYEKRGGGASRFFTSIDSHPEVDVPFRYVAKPSKRERTCDGTVSGIHPTVKPLALMRWLVRLVTPPGGTVLEPFAGSGTTLMACVLEGFHGIGIEMTDEYLPIIDGRVQWAREEAQREAEASESEQESLF